MENYTKDDVPAPKWDDPHDDVAYWFQKPVKDWGNGKKI